MKFASIRMITDDPQRVVQFYEQVTGVSAVWPASSPSCVCRRARSLSALLRRHSCSITRPARRTTTP
jgi:hypothetical protein